MEKAEAINKSYYKSTIDVFITNLLLGIPGGMGLALLSRFIQESFLLNLAGGFAGSFTFLLMSFHVFTKGVCSPICGYYADQKGRRFTVIIGGIISIIGSFLTLISTFNIIICLIIGVILLGGGRGFFMTSFNIIAGDIGEKYGRIGHAESFCDGLYVIGAILGGAIILFTEIYFLIFLFALIFLIIAFFVLVFRIKETYSVEIQASSKENVTLKSLIKQKNFFPTLLFAFTVEGAESGYIATTLPLIVASFAEINKASLFTTFPFSFGLGIFFLIAGFLNDRKGRKNTALLGCGLMIIFSLLAAFFMISPLMIFLIIFLFSGSSSFIRSTIESTWSDITDLKTRGKTYGYFRFFNELGGVVQPLIVTILLLFGLPYGWSALLITIFAASSLIIGQKYFKETLKQG